MMGIMDAMDGMDVMDRGEETDGRVEMDVMAAVDEVGALA